MRGDGRGADALRTVRLEPDFTENPLASVLCRVGRTIVLCTVCAEDGVPRFLRGSGRGWITAEYAMLPGATDRRSERDVSRGRPSGRSQEIQRLIGRSLRAIADLDAVGERTLWIDCDVLQADGGTRCAAITGAYAALAIAAERLVRRDVLARNPLCDSVAAVSVGVVGWVFPNAHVIDPLGLNDYVVARSPLAVGAPRAMAHDRRPPPGYLDAFRPGLRIGAVFLVGVGPLGVCPCHLLHTAMLFLSIHI